MAARAACDLRPECLSFRPHTTPEHFREHSNRCRQCPAAWLQNQQKSGSQVQAAQTAFGDLKQFGRRIEGYARQSSFMVGLVKSGEIFSLTTTAWSRRNRCCKKRLKPSPTWLLLMKPWATTTTGSRSSAKSTQKSKRLSSWAPRVLRRSIFTESFCCNKGAWTRHCERSQEKPGKGDSAQSAVRARLRRIVPGLCAVPGIAEGSGQRSY